MEEERAWQLLDLLGPDGFDQDLADNLGRIIIRTGSSAEMLRRIFDRTSMRMVLAIYGPVWAMELGNRLALHGARFIGNLEVTRIEENRVHIADQWDEWIVFPDPALVRDYVVPNIINMIRSDWGDGIPRQYIEINDTYAGFDAEDWAGMDVGSLDQVQVIVYSGLEDEFGLLNHEKYDAALAGDAQREHDADVRIANLISDARSQLIDAEAERFLGEIQEDPIGFAIGRGYGIDFLPDWITIDWDQAADDWIDQNGLGLEETYYLPSGAVAIRME